MLSSGSWTLGLTRITQDAWYKSRFLGHTPRDSNSVGCNLQLNSGTTFWETLLRVNFRQTNDYCSYTGIFILSFSGVLRIPKGWRRVHISRSWKACSFPLKHSGLPSYLLYVLDFDKILLVFYRLCINKPESKTLKTISFYFLSS